MTKNYRPISLLPIFSKILERLIFNSKFNFLDKITFLQSVSLVLFQETPVLLNYSQLPMKFTKVLIAAQREMLRGFSSILQRLLIRFGMNVYFLNYSLMESGGIF